MACIRFKVHLTEYQRQVLVWVFFLAIHGFFFIRGGDNSFLMAAILTQISINCGTFTTEINMRSNCFQKTISLMSMLLFPKYVVIAAFLVEKWPGRQWCLKQFNNILRNRLYMYTKICPNIYILRVQSTTIPGNTQNKQLAEANIPLTQKYRFKKDTLIFQIFLYSLQFKLHS